MKANASKKVLAALLAVCMALALVACGGTEAPGSAAASGSTAASESSGPASTASQSEPASSQADPSAYTVTFEVPEGFGPPMPAKPARQSFMWPTTARTSMW